MRLHMKVGDTAPPVDVPIYGPRRIGSGPERERDFRDASVRFTLRRKDGSVKADGLGSVVGTGRATRLHYPWKYGEISEPGMFLGEFVVTYADGVTETFPNAGWVIVDVASREATR